MEYKEIIKDVADFPKRGVMFKDFTPLLQSPKYFTRLIDDLSILIDAHFTNTHIAGVEARGFVIGGGISALNGWGFIPIRKEGKLPPPKIATYAVKEYGNDILEVKENESNDRLKVVIVDDVLATGGTLKASESLLNNAGYDVVGAIVLMDLTYLHSEDILIGGKKVISLIQY